MQADVSPRNTAMASTNSGWPPLSTIYTTLSVRMVSEDSLGMLMRDMNSSSTSDDSSKDSSITSGGALDDCPLVAIVVALVGAAEVFVGCVAVGDWWVKAVGWAGGEWSVMGVAGFGVDEGTESLADLSLKR